MTYTIRDNTIEFRSETKTGCVRSLVQWYRRVRTDVELDVRELLKLVRQESQP